VKFGVPAMLPEPSGPWHPEHFDEKIRAADCAAFPSGGLTNHAAAAKAEIASITVTFRIRFSPPGY
jgi:hypothetical protein